MQSIYNIAEICAQKNVLDAIISPGSRSAPLTLAFARHPDIKTKVIGDERSAAFIALGVSQQTHRTTALVCTSGTAAYNYAPAVAEAYYQHIPLLILTADRPPEWIDQLDGQTIRQNEIFGRHVKKSYTLPMEDGYEDTRWFIERTISEAINLSQEKPQGPVHINIPLREPLYPAGEIKFEENVKVIHGIEKYYELPTSVWDSLFDEFHTYNKVLIVAGQEEYNKEFNNNIQKLLATFPVVVVSDVIGNFQSVEEVIRHHDAVLGIKSEYLQESLQPELLITFGKSIISKNLKLFLRKHKPKVHWHIQEAGTVADTYQSLNRIIPVSPAYFFEKLSDDKIVGTLDYAYRHEWYNLDQRCKKQIHTFFQQALPFTEFKACYEIMNAIPNNSIVHLSNSMPVRYANLIGLEANKHIEVFSNRGTSGIDGVMSTALGAALQTDKLVVVIIGDMAFFYDRNAFWHNYLPPNLRIVVLNNHGGGIFRMLEGSGKQPELEEFFETKQPLKAETLAKEFNLDYYFCNNEESLQASVEALMSLSNTSKLLEIETDTKTNREIFYQFKNYISKD